MSAVRCPDCGATITFIDPPTRVPSTDEVEFMGGSDQP